LELPFRKPSGAFPKLHPATPLPKQKSELSSPLVRVCPQCTAIVPKGFKFCGSCGARYVDPSQEHVQLTPPPLGGSSQPGTQYLKLIHIYPNGQEGESIILNGYNLTIGRKHHWPIFQRDGYLAPKQATFYTQEGKIYLRDEDSLNGTFVKLKVPTHLDHGDLFRAGQQLFRFERIRAISGGQTSDGTRRLGSPLYQTWGRLGHVLGQGRIGRAWLLQENQVEMGRISGHIQFSQDRFMSSRHCALILKDDQIILNDHQSTNGTFLRIKGSVEIEQNDLILFGQQIFRVDLGLD
jgi:pSer/pThr/pTyr-binding forkhead associated (FHA) protein